MNSDYILLTGLKHPKRVEEYFAAHLVDVAYAEPLSFDRVKILVERETDLRKEKSVKWILELVTDALQKCGEKEFSTEIVFSA